MFDLSFGAGHRDRLAYAGAGMCVEGLVLAKRLVLWCVCVCVHCVTVYSSSVLCLCAPTHSCVPRPEVHTDDKNQRHGARRHAARAGVSRGLVLAARRGETREHCARA